jgi:hypothetical protein
MKKLFLLPTLFLFACSSPDNTKERDTLEQRVEELENEIDSLQNEQVELEALPTKIPDFAKDGLDFGFAGYIVSIDSVFFDYSNDKIIPPTHDTCYYDLDLGENINEKELRIGMMVQNEFAKFEVFQRDLYHHVVSGEGPHCDIVEIEPYYSDWIPLDVKEENFRFKTLSWKDTKAPKVKMSDKEFRKLVVKHCGEDWARHLDEEWQSPKANDNIGNSGHQIKIVATKTDGSTHVSIIQFSSPMGC